MIKMKTSAAILAAMIFATAGCRTNGLDRTSALALLKKEKADTSMYGFFPTGFSNDGRQNVAWRGYRQLIEKNLIKCSDANQTGWIECTSTSMFLTSTIDGRPAFFFGVGYWEPTEVTGISKNGDADATAEVRISLIRNPAYETNAQVLADVTFAVKDYDGREFRRHPVNLRGDTDLPALTDALIQPRLINRKFKLFDDGWRLESIAPAKKD